MTIKGHKIPGDSEQDSYLPKGESYARYRGVQTSGDLAINGHHSPRKDPHLDFASWDTHPDKGCEESSLCRMCPLIACKYDNLQWWQEYRQYRRYRGIAFVTFMFGVVEAARVLGISRRTPNRALKAIRTHNQWSAWRLENPEWIDAQ